MYSGLKLYILHLCVSLRRLLTVIEITVPSIDRPMKCMTWQFEWRDNRMAVQHLPWDQVQPSSGLNKLAQTMKKKN